MPRVNAWAETSALIYGVKISSPIIELNRSLVFLKALDPFSIWVLLLPQVECILLIFQV